MKIDTEKTFDAMNDAYTEIKKQSKQLLATSNGMENVEKLSNEISIENKNMASETENLTIRFKEIQNLISIMTGSLENIAHSSTEVSNSILSESNEIDELNTTFNSLENLNNEFIEFVINQEPNIPDSDRVLTMAVSPYAPISYNNKKTNEIIGIDIDLIKGIFNKKDIKVKVFLMPWNNCIEMVEKGLIDMIASISINKEREKFIDFSYMYREGTKFLFLTKKENNLNINNYSDLSSYNIGVMDSYTYVDKFYNDNKLNKDINLSEETMFEKIIKDQIDIMIIDEYIAKYFIKELKLENKITIQPFYLQDKNQSEHRLGFSKKRDYKYFKDIFEEEFKIAKENGTVQSIENKYLA